MQSKETRKTILSLGNKLGPDILSATLQLFDQEQKQLVDDFPAKARDIPYGPHQRNVLDIYTPNQFSSSLKSVIVFIHGGGFLRGDKGSDQHWHNSNVGRMAAREGYIGVVINYRLAPDSTWPSGGEDVAATVEWLKNNINNYGGNPEKIILIGTSAGSVHISTYLQLQPQAKDICAAVLLSGLYGCTPLDERDTLYYGEDFLYPARNPLTAVTETHIPLLIACAECDPPRFQTEFNGLLKNRIDHHGCLPRSLILSGHNHFSLPIHLGTSDTRLSDEIFSFIDENS